MKIVAVIIGLLILALIYLDYKGIITINNEELGEATLVVLGLTGQAKDLIGSIITHLPFAGAFGLALFLGFKMG